MTVSSDAGVAATETSAMVTQPASSAEASLPALLKELQEAHYRVWASIRNTYDLFEQDPKLAKAYLEIGIEEMEKINAIEVRLDAFQKMAANLSRTVADGVKAIKEDA